MSLAPTPVSPKVDPSDFFGFPFCQRLWDLTKRRDNIVAYMVADMMANMMADMKVANKVADMVTKKIDIYMGIQFG